MGDTQENSVAPWHGPSHHLKYYLQLKAEEDVEGLGTGNQEKTQ